MANEADKLMQSLVSLAVTSERDIQRERLRKDLPAVSARTWSECLVRLDEHRLMPLAHHGLAQAECLDQVPSDVERLLRSQFDYSRATNLVRWMALQGLVLRLREAGVTPTACKGLVLSRRYYPDAATRHMNDVDLWVTRKDLEATHKVLISMGFVGMPEKDLPDGACYRNSLGIVIDLHNRMRLFEGLVGHAYELTEEYEPNGFRVHEPHALLAHLLAHQEVHQSETGPMLCWLLDLGYVVQRDAARLNVDRLKNLVGQVANWHGLLASLRLLNEAFSMELPDDLLRLARDVEPLDLAGILRQRRLALWGLPRPRGWARLLVAALRKPGPNDRPKPKAKDLAYWPLDLVRARWARPTRREP